MQIKRLQLKNFKKFKLLDVNLQGLDCLIGSNNSGKSTLLQALALFDFCLHQCLSKENGKGLVLKPRSIPEEDFVVLPVTRGTDLWHDKIWQARNKHILIEIIVTFDNDKYVETTLDFNFNRFSIKTTTENNEEWLEQLRKFKISYLPVFSTFLIREEKRTQLAIRNELGRGNVNVVIRNLLLALKEEGREQALKELLQRAFPSIEKLSIDFDEASMQYITVTYLEKGKKKEFDIFSSGSGFQQFIYLFGFILLEQPNVILLDEPDVHLHGQLQKSLFIELQRLTQHNNKQVLFATHSRDLISTVAPENIIYLQDSNAARLHLDYQVFNALENLGSMETTQLVVLQEFRRVLVVENKYDWDTLQLFGNLVIGEAKMQEIAKRLAICYAYGNPTKQDMPKIRRSFQDMFTKTGAAIKMFVVADRDYFPYIDELKIDLSKSDENILWFIWEKNELENYLLDTTTLLKLVKPRASAQIILDEAVFLHQINQLVAEQQDDIHDRFIKGFEDYSKRFKKTWESSRFSKEARDFLKQNKHLTTHWVDAKKILGSISNWLKENQHESFSNQKLISLLTPDSLPEEMTIFFDELAKFAGVHLVD